MKVVIIGLFLLSSGAIYGSQDSLQLQNNTQQRVFVVEKNIDSKEDAIDLLWQAGLRYESERLERTKQDWLKKNRLQQQLSSGTYSYDDMPVYANKDQKKTLPSCTLNRSYHQRISDYTDTAIYSISDDRGTAICLPSNRSAEKSLLASLSDKIKNFVG